MGQCSGQTAKGTELTLHGLSFAKACQAELRHRKCQGIDFTHLKRKTFLSCQILTPPALLFGSKAPELCEHLPASSLGTAPCSLSAPPACCRCQRGQPATNPGNKPTAAAPSTPSGKNAYFVIGFSQMLQ